MYSVRRPDIYGSTCLQDLDRQVQRRLCRYQARQARYQRLGDSKMGSLDENWACTKSMERCGLPRPASSLTLWWFVVCGFWAVGYGPGREPEILEEAQKHVDGGFESGSV